MKLRRRTDRVDQLVLGAALFTGHARQHRLLAAMRTMPVLLAVLFTGQGCSGPMSTLQPAGPSAAAIASLWWIMLAGAAAILLLVLVLLVLAFRRPPGAPSKSLWLIGGGIVFPAVVLSALLVVGIILGERSIPSQANAIRVNAEASQFTWSFSYPDTGADPTIGVLHIPAGQPVTIALTTQDVIHSFWVPRLGGKMDAIPGRVNLLTLEASAPGEYHGLCAEYCGVGHSAHGFRVVAHPLSEWQRRTEGRTAARSADSTAGDEP